MKFAKRMDNFQEGVFATLLRMKQEKIEKGDTVVDLSIGAPNIPPADHILKVMAEEVQKRENYVYAISDTSELHQAVAQWYKRRYQVEIDPDREVVSLLGSQEGLSHIALSIADQGDIVLAPDPCYPVFADGGKIAGAQIYYMPLKKEKDYLIDFDEIPKDIASKAKLIIVSYPNNPTTAMAPDWFYEKLISFARENHIIVLHDNAYSELVFDGKKGGSFLSFPGAKEVGVEFNSLSKTYGLAGARIGFCIGNAQVVSMLTRLKSNMDYGMFLPIQKAAVAAITGEQTSVADTCKAYERRRNALCDGLTSIGWPVARCSSTMFVWAKLPEGYYNSVDFVKLLLDKAGVMVTPGSAFGPSGEGYVRMALVQNENAIQTAVQNIKASKILLLDL